MIAWNEAQTIDLALKGITGLVDEVIIADTGSWDGTIEKAEEWMGKLDLAGEVKSVKARTLGEARRAALDECQHQWILLIDSNLVISRASHAELKTSTELGFAVWMKPVNLMGDYLHRFKPQPSLNFHLSLFNRNQIYWKFLYDRPRPKPGTNRRNSSHFTANLSRVRPSWRCYIRGEPYDPRFYRHYPKTERTYKTESNFQWSWGEAGKYYSPLEYFEVERGLDLDEIKSKGSKWYLKMLQQYAEPLSKETKQRLPDVIMEELKNPRYKLVKREGKIVGREPTL